MLIDQEVELERGLQEANTRLRKNGQWRKARTIIVLPTGHSIPTRMAMAMWDLALPMNNHSAKIVSTNAEVGAAYSEIFEAILKDPTMSEWEYILTIEHDNIPPRTGLLELIRDLEAHPELSAVGALYYTKGEHGVPQIWGDPAATDGSFSPLSPGPDIVECRGLGMGFTLYRVDMFKDPRLRRPFFVTNTGTHDLYFWDDASRHGYRCGVDCRVKVGHMDIETGKIW